MALDNLLISKIDDICNATVNHDMHNQTFDINIFFGNNQKNILVEKNQTIVQKEPSNVATAIARSPNKSCTPRTGPQSAKSLVTTDYTKNLHDQMKLYQLIGDVEVTHQQANASKKLRNNKGNSNKRSDVSLSHVKKIKTFDFSSVHINKSQTSLHNAT